MTHATLTYLVYFSILSSFFIFPLFSKVKKNRSGYSLNVHQNRIWLGWSIMLPCVIYAFLVGLRYNYGFDWEQYYYTFQFIQRGTLYRDTTEVGYLLINRLIGLCGGNIYSLFVLEGFLWAFAICYLLKYDKKAVRYVLPLFIMSTWFRVLNLSRQHFAMSFFFIAIVCLLEGKKKWYIFWTIIAASIHTSVLIFAVPFFFLDKIKKIPSLKVSLMCYLGIVLAKSVMQNAFLVLGTLFTTYVVKNKGYTADTLLADRFQWEISLSKMLCGYFLDIVTILGIHFLLKRKSLNIIGVRKPLEYYFCALGLLGAILRPMGESHEIFSRTFMYFTYFEYICFGLWVYYMVRHFKSIPMWLNGMTIFAVMYKIYSGFFSLKFQISAGNYIEYFF